MIEVLILVFHVLAAVGVIGFVLLQHGKGADMGAAFGSGASGSLFGSTGSANFLSRTTAVLAVVFFLTSMALTYFSTRKTEHKGVMVPQSAPVKPGPTQIPGAPAGQSAPSAPPQPVPGAAPESGSKAQDEP